jgi:hypothetical protein
MRLGPKTFIHDLRDLPRTGIWEGQQREASLVNSIPSSPPIDEGQPLQRVVL